MGNLFGSIRFILAGFKTSGGLIKVKGCGRALRWLAIANAAAGHSSPLRIPNLGKMP
jgi:hypothetical protein